MIMLAALGGNRSGVSGISRRRFLGSAAAIVASAGPAKHLLAAEPHKKTAQEKTAKVVVGANPWVYAARRPGYDITDILPKIFADMRYAGMDGIELMQTNLQSKDAVERIGHLSQKHRLSIIGASFEGNMWDRTQHAAILKDAELIVPRLGKLGGRTLGTSVGAAPQKKTAQQLDAQAELMSKIIAICEANGVVLNLHNYTQDVADDMYELKGMLKRIPGLKLGPDLDWLVHGGVDPAAFIRQFGKRVVFMHLRDQDAEKNWTETLGEGVIDYVAISKALHKVDFQGDVVIELAYANEFKPTRPLRENLKISREFVRRVLGY